MANIVGPNNGQGRIKGTKNKVNRTALSVALSILDSGRTPLELMYKMSLAKLPTEPQKRMDFFARFQMLEKCAPYVHPKLQAVAVTSEQANGGSMSHEQILLFMDQEPGIDNIGTAYIMPPGMRDEEELDPKNEVKVLPPPRVTHEQFIDADRDAIELPRTKKIKKKVASTLSPEKRKKVIVNAFK